MPCKIHNARHRETCCTYNSDTRRTRYACIIVAHESTRTRTGKIEARDHEDLLAEKEFNSLSHYNLVHKPVPVLQPTRIPDAKADGAKMRSRKSGNESQDLIAEKVLNSVTHYS